MKSSMTHLLFVVVVFVLASCITSVQDVARTPTITVTNPKVTRISPATPTIADVTPTIADVEPIETPDATSCPEPIEKSPEEFLEASAIIFLPRAYKSDALAQFYLLGSQTMTLQPFLSTTVPTLIGEKMVSPDNKWLAFYDSGQLTLTTSNPNDKLVVSVNSIPWDWGLEGWSSDGQNLLNLLVDTSENALPVPETLYIYNPFTQENRSLKLEIPSKLAWFWAQPYSHFHVQYSPQLDQAVYLENPSTMVIVTLNDNKEIGRVMGENLDLYVPKWSPSGEFLAFVFSAEFNKIGLIDRNGEELKPNIVANGSILSFDWSPNGRYLAYWSIALSESILKLYIYDLLTQQSFDTCVTEPMGSGYGSELIWAPSGQQFIVGAIKTLTSATTELQIANSLIDIEDRASFDLANINLRPVAWLIVEK